MKAHTLSSMRDHLLALSEIQSARAAGAPDKAGDIAERRLGMGSPDGRADTDRRRPPACGLGLLFN